jgi:hypothetical protein
MIVDALFNILHNFERPHSDFLNFFDGIRIVTPEVAERYPAISRTIDFLRASQGPELEETRLKCLFYIAIRFKAASRAQFDLSLLNDSLELTEHVWRNSVDSLRWLLLQGMGCGPENQESLQRVEKLGEIAGLLKEYPWRRMEDRLLGILLGENYDGAESTSYPEFPEETPSR